MDFDTVYEPVHHGQEATQYRLIPCSLIDRPRDKYSRIPPATSQFGSVQNVWHYYGDPPVRSLGVSHILQPRCQKSSGTEEGECRWSEHGNIASPAQALITLGAISGKHDEVVHSGPAGVLEKPIQLGSRGLESCQRLHLG